ncbi:SMEK domain-containing protein [Clostridium guangxiense]|uniref:SMEK domain-containing protein n=1 Tax=Clostridium guangxiense TaxID=1662055 RepID=UPI001E48D5AE|nr:SMEK domain-containing protein [Clostridium guangxiense]MCD2348539.1 SMEK domain-containing protein [Clostridium guangxiense]
MMNKEIYLKNVAESLALLSKQVELLNAVNLYDINIIAEDFFTGLLNLIFGYKLKNANVVEKNAQAIDLIDEENKISIQVTSDNSSTKIKHTIHEYIDNKSYEKYDRLIVLILTRKKKYSNPFDTNNTFIFDKGSDILDIKDLIKSIRGLEIEKIREINDFLGRELCDKVYSAKETQANEIDTIIDLIEYISKHKEVKKKIDSEVDPEYKIFKRFKDFSERLISEYTTLYTLYGDAIETINETIGIDEAQDIIIMFYLQDISMQFLDETNDNPIKALNKLVGYFEDKLSVNGKKYDRAAIKFYLVNEMIKCRVFPNERDEYNGGK